MIQMDRIDAGPWDRGLIEQVRRSWFSEGRSNGFRYMLICQDTFDLYDPDMGLYSEFVRSRTEAEEFQAKQLTGIDVLVEVLDLSRSLEGQLTEPMKSSLKDLE